MAINEYRFENFGIRRLITRWIILCVEAGGIEPPSEYTPARLLHV